MPPSFYWPPFLHCLIFALIPLIGAVVELQTHPWFLSEEVVVLPTEAILCLAVHLAFLLETLLVSMISVIKRRGLNYDRGVQVTCVALVLATVISELTAFDSPHLVSAFDDKYCDARMRSACAQHAENASITILWSPNDCEDRLHGSEMTCLGLWHDVARAVDPTTAVDQWCVTRQSNASLASDDSDAESAPSTVYQSKINETYLVVWNGVYLVPLTLFLRCLLLLSAYLESRDQQVQHRPTTAVEICHKCARRPSVKLERGILIIQYPSP